MRTPSPAPRKVINGIGGTWVRKRAFWSGRGIISFDQPVPGSPDNCPPPPRPSKKGERCGGEGSPGWPPLDTRIDGSAAQGPPRAPSADPSIKGRALASLPQGPARPRPPPPPRAERGRSPARWEPENQTARVPAPGGTGGPAPAPSASSSVREAAEHGPSSGQSPGREGRSPPLGGEKAARA